MECSVQNCMTVLLSWIVSFFFNSGLSHVYLTMLKIVSLLLNFRLHIYCLFSVTWYRLLPLLKNVPLSHLHSKFY